VARPNGGHARRPRARGAGRLLRPPMARRLGGVPPPRRRLDRWRLRVLFPPRLPRGHQPAHHLARAALTPTIEAHAGDLALEPVAALHEFPERRGGFYWRATKTVITPPGGAGVESPVAPHDVL